MLLGTLGVSLLEKLLSGKGRAEIIVRAGYGSKQGEGIVRAGYDSSIKNHIL